MANDIGSLAHKLDVSIGQMPALVDLLDVGLLWRPSRRRYALEQGHLLPG
jgi:hypothetical protein